MTFLQKIQEHVCMAMAQTPKGRARGPSFRTSSMEASLSPESDERCKRVEEPLPIALCHQRQVSLMFASCFMYYEARS